MCAFYNNKWMQIRRNFGIDSNQIQFNQDFSSKIRQIAVVVSIVAIFLLCEWDIKSLVQSQIKVKVKAIMLAQSGAFLLVLPSTISQRCITFDFSKEATFQSFLRWEHCKMFIKWCYNWRYRGKTKQNAPLLRSHIENDSNTPHSIKSLSDGKISRTFNWHDVHGSNKNHKKCHAMRHWFVDHSENLADLTFIISSSEFTLWNLNKIASIQ